ncbi:hypothetical protein ElyMa_004310600 [Elysia marginata]|uniref:Uncharacterized protein n=1 Tax=Elysia marginata TaxID=1093978 RepID=A0AAV4GZF8_9GAST|nr:hypothetical protein ElyMa_004310600 [Elysia marginata]
MECGYLYSQRAARPLTPVFVVEPVNGGIRRTLHRNLLLPVEGVREDNPDVSPDNQAVQKVPLSTRDNGTSKSISATPTPVLREDGVKGTTSELEDGEDGKESDPDDDEFVILVPESHVQIPETCLCVPQPVNDFQPVAEEVPVVDQNSPSVPLKPPSDLSPPVPLPHRSVRPKQPTSWQTAGEILFSIIDKMTPVKSLLTVDGADKSIVTNATVPHSRSFLSFIFHLHLMSLQVWDNLPRVGSVCEIWSFRSSF